MAAKQGLTAQLSQASEDAKRAVLKRTPLKSSWFSNMNTTCTIKSAPPRTPDVLSLLSTKSGFLYKRNEQHVWQSRWCCVVPHMFLYYFDACADGAVPPPPGIQDQGEWNAAITSSGRKTTAPRSSLNIFHSAVSNNDTETPTAAKLQPAGIIDLECYTNVHRSASNPELLELSGDDSLNPDLRSFYFCAESPEHGDEWTQALLNSRHAALLDEREAYRQVCDGFAIQLQDIHQLLDEAQKQKSDAEEDCYRIRSANEESRRQCTRLIQDALERDTASNSPFAQARRAYRTDVETVRQQDMGLASAVQLLCDYVALLEESCCEMNTTLEEQKDQLQRQTDGDSRHKKELQALLKAKTREWEVEKETYSHQIQRLEQQLALSQKMLKDAQQDLASQKMEMTMLQSTTKARAQELSSHKKILKKEVIDLRRRLDEVGSELSLLNHTSKSSKMEAEQERKKTELLERYVEKMESQVRVQQNMMEVMSQQGLENVSRATYDDSAGPDYDRPRNEQQQHYRETESYESREEHHEVVLINTPSDVDDDNHRGETDSQILRKVMEEDNKSQFSELTEDPFAKPQCEESFSPLKRQKLPPSQIGLGSSHPRLDTISSQAMSLPPRSDRSVSSAGMGGSQRLSVAQRARLEAEKKSGNTLKIRVPPAALQRSTSQNSFFGSISKSFSGVIDTSMMAESQRCGTSDSEDDHSADRPDSDAASRSSSLSLSERQQIQRANQMAFLKEQGLVK